MTFLPIFTYGEPHPQLSPTNEHLLPCMNWNPLHFRKLTNWFLSIYKTLIGKTSFYLHLLLNICMFVLSAPARMLKHPPPLAISHFNFLLLIIGIIKKKKLCLTSFVPFSLFKNATRASFMTAAHAFSIFHSLHCPSFVPCTCHSSL